MKKLSTLLFLIFSSMHLQAQLNIKDITDSRIAHEYSLVFQFAADTWQSMGLNGKVKSITQNHQIAYQESLTEGIKKQMASLPIFNFDEVGRLNKKTTDYYFPIRNNTTETNTFKDNKSVYLAEKAYTVGVGEQTESYSFIFEYNGNKLTNIQKKIGNENKHPYMQFVYMPDGKITQATSVMSNTDGGAIASAKVYNYIYNGNRLDTIIQYTETINSATHKYDITDTNLYAIFRYNKETGKLQSIEGENTLKISFEYDYLGLLIKETERRNYGTHDILREILYLRSDGELMGYRETKYENKAQENLSKPNRIEAERTMVNPTTAIMLQSADNSRLNVKTVIEYLENGIITSSSCYNIDQDGKEILVSEDKVSVVSDAQGNVVYHELCTPKGEFIQSDTNEIEYFK